MLFGGFFSALAAAVLLWLLLNLNTFSQDGSPNNPIKPEYGEYLFWQVLGGGGGGGGPILIQNF